MTFPTMHNLQNLTRTPIGTDAAMRALILKAIYTAVQAGSATTASISSTGPTADDMSKIFSDLGASGLTVTNSGSTFTVGWGSI
jgi:hypothetical protein